MTLESSFRNSKVLPLLQTLNFTWYESIQQMSINGSPDIILGIRGKIVLLELKAPDGTLSKLQAHKLHDALLKGNLVFVARPQNWDIVKRILIKLDKGVLPNGTETSLNHDEIRRRIGL